MPRGTSTTAPRRRRTTPPPPGRGFYDLYHRAGERGFDLDHERDSRVYERLSRLLPTGARVLDIGCGDGDALGGWAREHDIGYVGVDIAPSAVEQAAARGYEVHLVDDSATLPFSDRTFDAAVAMEVIEHLFAPEATLREALRVLRPGGLVILTTPNVAYWRRRLDLALLGRWNPMGYSLAVSEPWGDPHIRFFNPGSLARLLRKVGATDVRITGHGGSVLGDVPWLPRGWRPSSGSPPYRWIEARLPSPFACFLMGVGRRPPDAAA